jgi:AcrR family transcriptional regulator
MAVAPRRVGAENSATRALILDATETLMLEKGYAAASTRRVAAQAGLKPSLVHYYFPTTDDLLLAVYRRAAEWSQEGLQKALEAPDPLQALWTYNSDTSRTGLTLEFMALASHRKNLRAEIAAHAEMARQLQVRILERILGDRAREIPPLVLSVLIASMGRAIVMEEGLGITGGHAEAHEWFRKFLAHLHPEKG